MFKIMLIPIEITDYPKSEFVITSLTRKLHEVVKKWKNDSVTKENDCGKKNGCKEKGICLLGFSTARNPFSSLFPNEAAMRRS